MGESVLEGKRILIVDDEPDVLETLEEVIADGSPGCMVDKARTYDEAIHRLAQQTYDLVILDIMGVNGFQLLEHAVKRGLRVAMLTAHALSPEALKKSFDMGARAYLPKETMGQIIPFLEDVLTHDRLTGWKRILDRLKSLFDQKFETDWEKKTGMDWKEWGKP